MKKNYWVSQGGDSLRMLDWLDAKGVRLLQVKGYVVETHTPSDTPANRVYDRLVACPVHNMNLDQDGYCPKCGEYWIVPTK